MRLLIVGPETGPGGGVAAVADSTVVALRAEGHEVERAVLDRRPRRRPNRANVANAIAVVRDAHAVATRARRSRAELVWVHAVGVPTLPALRVLAVALAVRATGCRTVVQLHAYGLEESVGSGGRVLRVVLRVLGRVAHRVVVLHGGAASSLAELIPAARLDVVPNQVTAGAGAPMPPPSPFRLVYVGALIERKGLRALLDAVREMDDVALEIVGGPGEDGPELAATLEASA